MTHGVSWSRRSSLGGSRLSWLFPLVLIILVAAALLQTGGGTAAHAHPRDPDGSAGRAGGLGLPPQISSSAPVDVRATIGTATSRRLPRSFLGLSIEYWDLLKLDRDPASLRRVFGLVRVPGDGPVILRVGGDSADQSYWGARSPGLRLGPWPYRLTGSWLRKLAAVTRAARLHVILDLNLAAQSASMAARFARAASRTLPRGSLSALEIGNEPDIYHHWVDYHLPGRRGLFAAPSGWDEFSPSGYAAAFSRYARLLQRAVPGLPLAGPEAAYPLRDLAWARRLVAADRPRLGLLTVHRYSLSACAHRNWRDFSTIARVLSPGTSAGLSPSVIPALRLARRSGLPLRLTELNSVTCEGRRGVSNTFAAALWAPDALFSLWRVGLAGVNIHVRQGAVNAAFEMSGRRVLARPLLYGLALFTRALGERARLARLRVGPSPPAVRIWAVRVRRRRLNVLVLNKGAQPARLLLRVPTRRPAAVQRLLAPSIQSTGGVTLAGQTIGPRGRWLGRRVSTHVSRGPGGRYGLLVPGFSAALVSFRL